MADNFEPFHDLRFDESSFTLNGGSESDKEIQQRIFMRSVRNSIKKCVFPYLDSFSFTFSNPQKFTSEITSFVDFAMERRTKWLLLDFSDPMWVPEDFLETHPEKLDLPSNVYEKGRLLEALTLHSCKFETSLFGNFMSLKCLTLGWMELKISVLKAVVLSCPFLDFLCLKKCWNLEQLDVIFPSLSVLIIDKCMFNDVNVNIEAKKLRMLTYAGQVGRFHLQVNRHLMREASLEFGVERNFGYKGDLLVDLLRQIYCVRVMTVCSYMLQILPCVVDPNNQPFLMQVNHLTLRTALHRNEFIGIGRLLKVCPLLETLSIEIKNSRIFEEYKPPYGMEGLEVHECVAGKLKKVTIKGFTGKNLQRYMLKYLLSRGVMLQEVRIEVANEGDIQSFVKEAENCVNIEKASPVVEISIF